uniref:Uncharacterized protein n=2 Tax=Caenorhabditis japonica TaxID=281687 RepID=A0A8R1ILE6_CAEJA
MDNKMSRITEAQSYLHQSLETNNENMQMMQENFEKLNIKEQEMHKVAASRVAPDQESGTTSDTLQTLKKVDLLPQPIIDSPVSTSEASGSKPDFEQQNGGNHGYSLYSVYDQTVQR